MKVVTRFFATLCIAATLQACGGEAWRDYHGYTCGTTCNITYRAYTDLSDSITLLLNSIEGNLTVFDDASPVLALNRGDTVVASEMLSRVIDVSQAASAASGGAFDPTVGPLVDLWGFGATHRDSTPTDAEVDSALASVGIAECSIGADGIVRKKTPATTFNFGAVGKGFAAQEVAAMLQRNGVTDCMVEVGGDLALRGVNPHGSRWVIQIDAPNEGNNHDALLSVDITDCGIATSGNYRNYRDLPQGERVGHTINPGTGRPITTDVLSATVVTSDAAIADALATACMVLGCDGALEMASRNAGVEIMLVTADTTAADTGLPWRVITSPGFPLPR